MSKFLTQPSSLWLLLLVPVVIGLGWWLNLRRRRDLDLLATHPALAHLVRLRPWRRLGRQTVLVLGLAALIVSLAGPRWGRDAEQQVAKGRDLIVVLDLSRSMLAEQPSRQELAQRALEDLADSLTRHGGHRVGLVVFAAQPKLIVPLTHDYDHFREALADQDAAQLPPELRPPSDETPSGTRIGAALKLAASAFDPDTAGFQDILLVSDGDDPALDEEWAAGAEAARDKSIHVFTLGVGDPAEKRRIPGLEYEGKPVLSRLDERVLQEIAQRTQGTYLAARRQTLPPDALYRAVLESQRRHDNPAAALATLHPQYRWFLGAALGCLMVSLMLGDGRSRLPFRAVRWRPAFALLALLLISAAPQLRSAEQSIRDGNAAFAAEDYEAALAAFERAEERTADPGLVAFNKAATLSRLNRPAEARLGYARCLEDRALPPGRRVRALHDLGVTLMQLAKGDDAELLTGAIRCFTRCLADPALNPDLASSAEYNLELARMQWLNARRNPPANPKDNGADGNPKPSADKEKPGQPGDDSQKPQGAKPGKTAGKKVDPNQAGSQPIVTPETQPGSGNMEPLADTAALQPLDAVDAAAHLAQEAQRIAEDQRAHRRAAPRVATTNVKDW